MGKDTTARFMARILKTREAVKDIRIRSFASNLKVMAQELFGWDGLRDEAFYNAEQNAYLREQLLPTIGKSPREIWIDLGNYIRQIYINTWVDMVIGGNKCDVLIIPDVRYPNEVERIKKLGGVVIKVTRPGIELHTDVADSALADFEDWDYTLINNGNLHDLNTSAHALLKDIIHE